MNRFWLGGYGPGMGGSADGIGMLAGDEGREATTLAYRGVAARAASPSWLAQHPTLDVVYAALEGDGLVQAFARTGESALAPLGEPLAPGSVVCHLAVAPNGASLIASCYGDGRVVRYGIDGEGRLVPAHADAAAALRCLARANAVAPDDARLRAVARAVGADVPVCLASTACVMSGVGESLAPLPLPRLPCVLVNPRVAVATSEVFAALGLKRAELLVGARDIVAAPAWPKPGAGLADWFAVLGRYGNDLEAPALKIAPAVGMVLAALRATDGVRLARMSGSGATCFALYDDDAAAAAAAARLRRDAPQWWVHAGVLN